MTGFSLASFLQLLAQEKKSCILQLRALEGRGTLHIQDGNLIDAETEDGTGGLLAVYSMLGWLDPTFALAAPMQRLQRIDMPLTRLLLEAARHHDEIRPPATAPSALHAKVSPEQSPHDQIRTILRNCPGVIEYLLLDRRGHVTQQLTQNTKLHDLITFCIIHAGQAGTLLTGKKPGRIVLRLADDATLLVVPGGGGIIALHLAAGTNSLDLLDKLHCSPNSPAH